MPVTETFLAACRAAVAADPALAAFRAAYALYAAADRADKGRYWQATYGGADSPAHRLRSAVRGTVNALADATVTAAERESAVRTLTGELVPKPAPPADPKAEAYELTTALTTELLS